MAFENIRVAVIIPDRGDRPKFLANCLRMLGKQTLQPAHIELVNDAPISEAVDITWRYRTGYERIGALSQQFDLIAFIENDDFYHPEYLEYMATQWLAHDRPHMLGLNHTVYYHIGYRAWFTMRHLTRSSAMNTVLRPGMAIHWPLDHDPYTDCWLWHNWQNFDTPRKVIVKPEQEYCLGIKHGVGLCGGKNHTDHLHRYVNRDPDGTWFASVTIADPEAVKFYLGGGAKP